MLQLKPLYTLLSIGPYLVYAAEFWCDIPAWGCVPGYESDDAWSRVDGEFTFDATWTQSHTVKATDTGVVFEADLYHSDIPEYFESRELTWAALTEIVEADTQAELDALAPTATIDPAAGAQFNNAYECPHCLTAWNKGCATPDEELTCANCQATVGPHASAPIQAAADAPYQRNKYACYMCNARWIDCYHGQPESNCPECGAKHCTPYDSDEIDENESREDA